MEERTERIEDMKEKAIKFAIGTVGTVCGVATGIIFINAAKTSKIVVKQEEKKLELYSSVVDAADRFLKDKEV